MESPIFVPKAFRYVEFLATNDATAQNWQTWAIPDSASFLWMYLLASGSGGGGGRTGATATARGGGGGGGSGAQSVYMFPRFLLPDVLFINVGPGGAGGAANGAGTAGQKSTICAQQNVNAESVIAVSDAGNATGGGAGSTTTTGTAGAAGTINGGITGISGYAFFRAFAGIIGTTGGNPATPTAGANTAAFGSVQGLFSGGTGGGACSTGNVDTAGGNIVAAASPNIYPQISGGAVAGGRGPDGWRFEKPRACCGGVGGGGSSAGTGGVGSNGALGCGGGGGGGGITGGKGGRGGDGLIIIGWM